MKRGGKMDLTRARKAFKEYVSQYDRENGKVKNKIIHIQKVAENAKMIAEGLNLEKEDVSLAELIGLLHDIGRFEQIRRYNTFVDKDSVNHGKLGVEILFANGRIRDFTQENCYDEIIKQAILNHNIARVPEDIENPKIVLHSKIIRDADKIDIYRALIEENIQDTYCCDSMSEDGIKDSIVEQFERNHYINYADLDNGAERMIAHFAYIYDLNYAIGYQIIEKNQYISRLASKYPFCHEQTKEKIQKCAELAEEYVKEKAKNVE